MAKSLMKESWGCLENGKHPGTVHRILQLGLGWEETTMVPDFLLTKLLRSFPRGYTYTPCGPEVVQE